MQSHSVLFILLAIQLAGTTAYAQNNQRDEPFPRQNFARSSRGAEIPKQLGQRLETIAAWYDRTGEELRQLCSREKTLHMDREGRLHYVCEGLLPLKNAVLKTGTATDAISSSVAALTAAETFSLHSKPGASKVIYLDFDGHTTTGTSWNSSFTSGASITTPPYSDDSTISTNFSSTELANIHSIWQRVAEDYAPFDVDVTTQDPGVEALRKSTTSDTAYGVRVCIGGSSYDWYGAGAGGVAYLGSFSWNTDTPCFVFPSELGGGNAKYTAEAVSHEVGHTFNLSHDGQTNITEYYQGHSNWAPIMGVGYYKDVVQWSKGEYTSANNLQDDTAIIANICGYRTDAHGDVILSATKLTGTNVSASGIIERRTDADLFGFTTGAGAIAFSALPVAVSPNLDLQLALYDGFGNLVTYASPSTMEATLTTTVAQGTYYLAVEGVGTGDAINAYNDYGSLGQFSLSGTVQPVTGAPPIAVADNSTPTSGSGPLTVSFSSNGSYDPDGSIIAYSWDFGNGVTSNEANPVYTYSTAGTYTASLVVVDNEGLSSVADTVTVVVQSNNMIYVAGISMGLTSSKQGYQASATVTVRNQSGALVSGATITGQWSDLASGTVSRSTSRNGTATFTSSRTRSRGTFTFSVTGITLSGYTYMPSQNIETQDSIATP